jgi:glycosyltransferase involved in cell wall biosynthesis
MLMEARSHTRCVTGHEACPPLLDVTRLVSLRWTGRIETGIDRVCLAYLRHYRETALAVVQHRGIIRVLDPRASQALFDLLLFFGDRARRALVSQVMKALSSTHRPARGSVYLNVGHTDYDLVAHARWIRRHVLRPVYLIHDLIPVTHAEHCRAHAVRRHRGRVVGALSSAAGIIVTSRSVEQDLRRFASRNGLKVPPVTISPIAGAPLKADVAPLADDPGYFLCVGTIESRKNHRMLLEVWQRLGRRLGARAPRLVIVGSWGAGSSGVRRALSTSGMVGGLVKVVGRCDDGALARLMVRARAVLMPTLAEGYGLPMAEALGLGVPVIASDIPCFHEVGQGIPTLLDPHDPDAWEAKLTAFDDAAARRQRQIVGLHGYRPPTWDAHFAIVDPWIETAAGAGMSLPVPCPDGFACSIDGLVPYDKPNSNLL